VVVDGFFDFFDDGGRQSSVNRRNWSSAISRIMSADGIMTGGGVTVSASTAVRESVGDEMRTLEASSVRTAFR